MNAFFDQAKGCTYLHSNDYGYSTISGSQLNSPKTEIQIRFNSISDKHVSTNVKYSTDIFNNRRN